MENKTTVNEMVANRRVITRDGVVMSYAEYLEMVRSEEIRFYLRKEGALTRALSFCFRENNMLYYEKKAAVVSYWRMSNHLRWCHIRNKTERLSDRKSTIQDYIFLFLFIFAKITSSIMEGGISMTYKQIEASREARLWITQVALPIVGVVMLVPDARKAVMTKLKEAKKAVETKFKKN